MQEISKTSDQFKSIAELIINGNSTAGRSEKIKAGEGRSDRELVKNESGDAVSSNKEDQEKAAQSTAVSSLFNIRNAQWQKEEGVFHLHSVN